MSAGKEVKWFITKLVALSFIALFLLGCASPSKPAEPQLLVLLPDPVLLRDCEQPAPPTVANYVNQTWDEKERILVEDIRNRMSIISGCDSRFEALRKWRQQQSVLP